MVYESGFTTRRTYTRPVVSSYSYSYPVTRVYKTSYPIYSTYTRGPRVITSPIRVVTSPTRIVTRVVRSPSPVRVIRQTTRIISSPERTTSYSYSSLPLSYYSPSYTSPSYYTSSYSPTYYPSSTYSYTVPSIAYTPISRVYTRSVSPLRINTTPLRYTSSYLPPRYPAGHGARALTNYLGTEPFTTFREETDRIRHRANSLIRDIHTPVVRRARSCTPFLVSGYEPSSQLALDAYVARITNPIRHVAKEVHNMSYYPEPARKYVGKSHLASVRICGDRAYDIRRPMYDSDKVRNDINLMSWYMRHPLGKEAKKYAEKPTKSSAKEVIESNEVNATNGVEAVEVGA